MNNLFFIQWSLGLQEPQDLTDPQWSSKQSTTFSRPMRSIVSKII